MKSLGILSSFLLTYSVWAANSDILIATGGGSWTGSTVTNTGSVGVPGNLVFDGNHFVFPTTLPSSAIYLNFLNTNAVLVTSNALPINGCTPRILALGNNYLVAWLDTNATPSLLRAALFSNGTLGPAFTVGTNVAVESVALSGKQPPVVAVWQSEGSNSTVSARALNGDGSPAGDSFAITPSVQPQRFPAIDTDGANHLVCWMEQNAATNEWRVLARTISSSQPLSAVVTVSQTNSSTPFPTACSFGTNYLVLWSVEQLVDGFYSVWGLQTTNVSFAMVDGRMVTSAGEPFGDSFAVIRARGVNTNMSTAFSDGRYLVGASTGTPSEIHSISPALLQPLAANGARFQQPLFPYHFTMAASLRRLAGSAGRFCEVEWEYLNNSLQVLKTTTYASEYRPDLYFTNLQRTPGGGISASGFAWAEYTTNFVNWTPFYLPGLVTLTNHSKLFVRLKDARWSCVENQRAIAGAKQQWALEKKKVNTETPVPTDLYGPAAYIFPAPACPQQGYYAIGTVKTKPICTVDGHTL
jgi:hypothetical protein